MKRNGAEKTLTAGERFAHGAIPPAVCSPRRAVSFFPMKRLLFFSSFILLTSSLLFSGCCVVSGSRTDPAGATLSIRSYRLFWQSEQIDASVRDTNGVTFGLRVAKSGTDAESMQAAAAAGAAAAMQLRKP
jgi:hypothetical protein